MKKYKFLISIILIIICTSLIIIYKKMSTPRLEINGEILSYNEEKIYIDGAINKPGIYIFKRGSKLIDIINSAGGLSNSADIQNIDFDYVLKNGEKIIIPYIKEEISLVDENELININTATLEELMTLEGIGEKTAQNILEYRRNNEFEIIEDLMKVEGIGKGKFDKISAYIVVK